LKLCREHIATVNLFGGSFSYDPTARQYKEQTKSFLSTQKTSNKRARVDDDDSSPSCTGCGRSGHLKATCIFTTSKYFNKGGGKYIDSNAYANLKKDRPNHRDTVCPRDSLPKTTLQASSTATSSATASTPQNKTSSKKKKSKSTVSVIVSDSAVVPLNPTPEPDFKKNLHFSCL
jgi:hypothetical protein